MKPFEIFKPGTFTDNEWASHSFTEAMLADAAAVYDPQLHEAPLCIGHPANDAPAYGWVRGLSFSEESLIAAPDDVEPAFSEIVEAGRYKKRSAAFYPPKHPGNPKPGHWYLKHVAFLGAKAPAVKGLKNVTFSGDDEGVVTVEFGEAERTIGWAIRNLAEIGRRFRDSIIDKDGLEAADKLIPSYLIEGLTADAARIVAKNEPSFSEPNPEDPVKLTQEQIEARAAELGAKEQELKDRETKVGAQETAFSESEKKSRRTANAAVLDGLITEGKFAPGLKASTLDFMDGLDGVKTVEFGEGDGKIEKTPSDWFLDLLKQSGKVIDFSEHAPGSKQPPEPADPEEAAVQLSRDAVAFQEAEKAKGNTITIDQAVAQVVKQKGAVS